MSRVARARSSRSLLRLQPRTSWRWKHVSGAYKGGSHSLGDTSKDQFNADLLA